MHYFCKFLVFIFLYTSHKFSSEKECLNLTQLFPVHNNQPLTSLICGSYIDHIIHESRLVIGFYILVSNYILLFLFYKIYSK